MKKDTVGIIGAGMGGIAAARYLQSQGFLPTVFESHDGLGGQWNRANANSGVWEQMRINTAGFATKFSDVDFADGTAMFPRNGEVLDMVNAYVDKHELRNRFRFGSEVIGLSQAADGGYMIEWEFGGRRFDEHFDKAVVATGRFNDPAIPPVAGLDRFTGECGVIHTFNYEMPEVYLGKRILVLGGSISSLEIASDLAMMPTKRVHLSQRRQRYVMPKMFAGVPLEYYAFTRLGGIDFRTLPADRLLADTKTFLETMGGNPAKYGAPAPDEDMAKAGFTGAQHYLNLVAEDRIDVRPWVEAIDGSTARFEDGSDVEIDGVIFGTGFNLNLPFLSKEIAAAVNLTRSSIDLHEFTFHPDLDGLAFLGLYAQLGPYPTVLEQQARYISYAWGGAVPMPEKSEMMKGVEECIRLDHHGDYRQQHEMAVGFAKLTGCDPEDVGDPELQEIIDNSAVTGEMFRIVGPDALPRAADRVRELFWAHGNPDVKKDIASRYGRQIPDFP